MYRNSSFNFGSSLKVHFCAQKKKPYEIGKNISPSKHPSEVSKWHSWKCNRHFWQTKKPVLRLRWNRIRCLGKNRCCVYVEIENVAFAKCRSVIRSLESILLNKRNFKRHEKWYPFFLEPIFSFSKEFFEIFHTSFDFCTFFEKRMNYKPFHF